MDNVHDRRVHRGSRQILVRPYVELLERLSQLLRLLDVHSDELEYAVLRYYADDHRSTCFVIGVDYGYTPGTRFEHLAACFVYGSVGVDGDGLYGLDTERLLDVYSYKLRFARPRLGHIPRRLFKRNWSTLARASGFCQ
jgi:hypothetical protein